MTERKNALARLFAACWNDEALKARFLSDPRTVLAEHGIEIPDRIDVKVVENTDACVYITIPKRPPGELSDDDLLDAAGGGPIIDGLSHTINL